MLQTVLIVIHVLLAIFLIALILVQRGSGATAGAALGAGASATVFGSQGAGSFLTRTTAILAAGFLAISLGMAMLETHQARQAPDESLGVMATAPVADADNVEGKKDERVKAGDVVPAAQSQVLPGDENAAAVAGKELPDTTPPPVEPAAAAGSKNKPGDKKGSGKE